MLIALREPVFVFTRVGGGRREAMAGPEGSSSTRVMGSWHGHGEYREKVFQRHTLELEATLTPIGDIVKVELKIVLKSLWCVL